MIPVAPRDAVFHEWGDGLRASRYGGGIGGGHGEQRFFCVEKNEKKKGVVFQCEVW